MLNKFVTMSLGTFALSLLFTLGTSSAENWTRFRGPNGSGIATDAAFPSKWEDEDYLWKKQLPGIGHSSPVGWSQRLFITSSNADSSAVILMCLDASGGDELWQREFPVEQYSMHASNSYASTTPFVDIQHVYLSWASGGSMHCAALTHSGEKAWQVELGNFTGNHGFAASPVVVDGVVSLQVDHGESGEESYLVGLDATSGELLWRVKRPPGKASYATPCLLDTDDNQPALISQSMTGGMQAIDVHSGQLLWELGDVFPARTVSSPFLAGSMIIGVCGGGGSGKQLVGVRPNGSLPPEQKLLLTKHVPYVPTPLVKDNLMFLWHDQGKLSCVDLDAEDPSKLLWTERIGGKFFGSPILAGDKIYCMSMDGEAVVIAADAEFKLLGKTDLGEPTNATPAVHQGKMYLRTETSLACLGQE